MKAVAIGSGGGAMGAFQIQLLAEAEKRENKPIHEYYSLVVGASVASINLGMAATGAMKMADLQKDYPRFLNKAFKKRRGFGPPKFDRGNFRDIWDEYVGEDFRMGQCKTKLMIVATDLVSEENVFFKSWKPEIENEKVVDCICRSFAAPFYFGELDDPKDQMVYSDGGIGTQNFPIEQAKAETEILNWYGQEPILFDAYGCTFPIEKKTYKEVSRWLTIKQILAYMKPSDGGLARTQRRSDQVKMMDSIARHRDDVSFRYWDMGIPEKYRGMDLLKYVPFYVQRGEEAAKKPLIEVMHS